MPEFKDKVRIPDVKAIKGTDRAVLVEVDGENIWIPQSHIDDDSEVSKDGDEGTLVISEWIAKRKGLA